MSPILSSEVQMQIRQFVAASLKSDDFELTPLAGDASSRKYFRVVQGQKSWVLMLWEPFKDDGSYPFLSVLRHFRKHRVNVPEALEIGPSGGTIMLDDLGDLTLERKFWENQDQDLALPFYRQALDELIKIHYHASGDKDKSCTAFGIQFDTAKFVWEMNYGKEHLLEKLCGVRLSDSLQKELGGVFHSICSRLDAEPKFISHRDYHSRNLMLKLNKMWVIDFQDARMGPVQYDLVSLFHDSYVKLNGTSIATLTGYYLDRAREFLPATFSLTQFDEIMRLQLIQRCFKACGSFASFYNLRQDERYLKYLGHTLHKVYETLIAYPQYSVLGDVIKDNGLLERKFEAS